MNGWGDHALACTAAGIYRRHNKVRDTIASLCREAGWQAQLEVAIPPGSTRPGEPDLRPADVFLPLMGPRPVALDIGVSHALRPSAPSALRDNTGESADRHEASKRQKIGHICSQIKWTYKPLCFETLGAWGPTATRFIKQIVWTTALRDGRLPGEHFSRVANIISGCLAKGSAEMLVRAYGL